MKFPAFLAAYTRRDKGMVYHFTVSIVLVLHVIDQKLLHPCMLQTMMYLHMYMNIKPS